MALLLRSRPGGGEETERGCSLAQSGWGDECGHAGWHSGGRSGLCKDGECGRPRTAASLWTPSWCRWGAPHSLPRARPAPPTPRRAAWPRTDLRVFSHTLPHLVCILVETGPSCRRTQTPLAPGGLPGPCVRSKPCSTDSFHRGGSRGTENQVPLGRPSSLSLTRWGPVSSVADGPVLPRPPPSSPGECGLWEWNSCQQQVPRGAGHSL